MGVSKEKRQHIVYTDHIGIVLPYFPQYSSFGWEALDVWDEELCLHAIHLDCPRLSVMSFQNSFLQLPAKHWRCLPEENYNIFQGCVCEG